MSYQPIEPPRTAARATTEMSVRMVSLLSRGTNGNPTYTSFGGRAQGRLARAFGRDVSRGLALWTSGLLCTVTAIAATLTLAGQGLDDIWVVIGLAGVAAVAERGRVRLSATLEESISLLPTLFAAVVFGPLAAMLVGAASLSLDARRSPLPKWMTYTCTRSITGAATAMAASEAGALGGNRFSSMALATLVGAATAQTLDAVFASATLLVRRTSNPWEYLRTHLPLVVAAVPLYAPIVGLLAYAYNDISPWTLALFFAPALAAQRLYGLYQGERALAVDLVVANVRLERANLSFATALVATLDARDRYTAGHSAAVAVYARETAARLSLPESEQQLVHLCGLVHDIGKIGLPAGLLEKPGALTLEERRQMQEHSAIGEHILSKVEDYADIARIVRHHHERIDGMGYPDGITGDEIPLLSRIIAVADAYNAMTSDRPYRDAMPSRVARMRLAQGVEGQFDTAVVAAFEAVLAGASEEFRMGRAAEFTFEQQDRYSVPVLAARVA